MCHNIRELMDNIFGKEESDLGNKVNSLEKHTRRQERA